MHGTADTILDSGRVVSVQVYRDEAARDNDNGLDWIALFVTQMNVSRFKWFDWNQVLLFTDGA